MATSVVPAVIDALLSSARTNLPDLLVLDGAFESTDDPGDYLMVGVADPESNTPNAAQTSQSVANMGNPRDRNELGTIACTALSWNGDWTQKDARDAVYATFAAVENLLRADPSLGVKAGGLLVAGIGESTTFDQGVWGYDDAGYPLGLAATLTFQVAFRARI